MEIRLENLIPLPMKELSTGSSEIWEADSFIFEKGKKYLVEAGSGKGKTSLLSIIYGLRTDYAGKLFIHEEDSCKFSVKRWTELRKNELSFIFQGLELFDELSALENIQLKNNLTRHKNQEEIRRMAEVLDIGAFLNRKCRILSFGQKQRVAIIRALCQPFNFLLADECFSHIDKTHGDEAMQLINAECNSRGAGLIMTSLGNNNQKLDMHINL